MQRPSSKKSAPPVAMIYATQVATYDVLLGRGTGPNQHIGNCIFREEIDNRKEEYLSSTMIRRDDIKKEIIVKVHSHGGRFLKKSNKTDGTKRKMTVYEVIVDFRVLSHKIKQALRYSGEKGSKKSPFSATNQVASVQARWTSNKEEEEAKEEENKEAPSRVNPARMEAESNVSAPVLESNGASPPMVGSIHSRSLPFASRDAINSSSNHQQLLLDSCGGIAVAGPTASEPHQNFLLDGLRARTQLSGLQSSSQILPLVDVAAYYNTYSRGRESLDQSVLYLLERQDRSLEVGSNEQLAHFPVSSRGGWLGGGHHLQLASTFSHHQLLEAHSIGRFLAGRNVETRNLLQAPNSNYLLQQPSMELLRRQLLYHTSRTPVGALSSSPSRINTLQPPTCSADSPTSLLVPCYQYPQSGFHSRLGERISRTSNQDTIQLLQNFRP